MPPFPYISVPPFFPFGPLESPSSSSSSSWEVEEEEAEAEKTWDEYQEEKGGGGRRKSAELALSPTRERLSVLKCLAII